MTEKTKLTQIDRVAQIAALNDEYRRSLPYPGASIVHTTPGILAKIGDVRKWTAYSRYADLLRIVREFDDFGAEKDLHGERDFGAFEWEGIRCFWKFDYFDSNLQGHSSNAADPAATVRILTIMRADEY
jgi:hypothetical protein